MSVEDDAKKDWQNGAKLADISEKYGVSLSTVKSWATRHWKQDKKALKKKTESQLSQKKKVATEKPKRGAPKGNLRALGGGAPKGNQNATKHGGYSEIYWDTLTDEEKAMIEDIPKTEEDLILEQIQFFAVRERRLMQAIKMYKEVKGGLAVSDVTSSHTKRKFASDAEKEQYEVAKQQKISEGKIYYIGYDEFTQTTTESTYNIVQRLESELTRVQRAKTKAIDTLVTLRRLSNGDKGSEVVDDWLTAILGEGK